MRKSKFRKEIKKKRTPNITSLKNRCKSVDSPSMVHRLDGELMEERWRNDGGTMEERWRNDGGTMEYHRRKISSSYIHVR